jgi:arsenate reductase (thioredoxin)
MQTETAGALLAPLQQTTKLLISQFHLIPAERKQTLGELAAYIREKQKANEPVYLNFICTHNSRRSHIAQLWAQAAAFHYQLSNVSCFSGGTEATAFNPRAVSAMQKAGFDIRTKTPGENPVYEVQVATLAQPLQVFSKKYNDPSNPSGHFAAVMTCSHADENCPLVFGAEKRIAITYDDPKESDGTPREADSYAERVQQIGREMLYAFSLLKINYEWPYQA